MAPVLSMIYGSWVQGKLVIEVSADNYQASMKNNEANASEACPPNTSAPGVLQLIKRGVHPGEEQRMFGVNAVAGFCLRHGQTELVAQRIIHHA
eukprot:3358881-Amphidinium_carterae.1